MFERRGKKAANARTSAGSASLGTLFDTALSAVNGSVDDLLLAAVTYLSNIPGRRQDRAIVTARLLNTIADFDRTSDPEWLAMLVGSGDTVGKNALSVTKAAYMPQRWIRSSISLSHNRPKLPSAPSQIRRNASQRSPRRQRTEQQQQQRIMEKTDHLLLTPAPTMESNDEQKMAGRVLVGEPWSSKVEKMLRATLSISCALEENVRRSAIVEACQQLYNSPAASSFYLFDAATQELTCTIARGTVPTVVSSKIGLLGCATRTKELIVLTAEEAQAHPSFDATTDTVFGKPCHALYVPVFRSAEHSTIAATIKVLRIADKVGEVPFNDVDVMLAKHLANHVTAAIENEALMFATLQLSTSIQSTLRQLTVEGAVQSIVSQARDALQCEHSILFMSNRGGTHLISRGTNGMCDVVIEVSRDSLPGYCALQQEVIIVDHPASDNRHDEALDKQLGLQSRSLLLAPIVNLSTGKVLAVLVAVNKRGSRTFNHQDMLLMLSLTGTAGVVLQNALIHRAAVSSRRKTNSLLSIAKVLNDEGSDIPSLMIKMRMEATSLLECERCTVWMIDDMTTELWARVPSQKGDNSQIEIRCPVGKGFAGQCVAEATPINVEDAWDDPQFNSDIDRRTGMRTHAVLCCPIVDNEGEVLGCVQALNKVGGGIFSKMDEELLEAFSAQCAVSIENSRNQHRLGELQKYFEAHKSSEHDIIFYIDRNGIVRTASHPTDDLFDEPVDSIVGLHFESWLGEVNAPLQNLMHSVYSTSRMVVGSSLTFHTKKERALHMDINVTPMGVGGEEASPAFTLGAPAEVEGVLFICSNISVQRRPLTVHERVRDAKETLGLQRHVVEDTPMLYVNFSTPEKHRDTIMHGIVREIVEAKGAVVAITSSTIAAVFGVPFSSSKDTLNACDAARNVLSYVEVAKQSEHVHNVLPGSPEYAELILHTDVHVCVGSAAIRMWNRGQPDSFFERDASAWTGVDPMHWLLQQGRKLGARLVVDSAVWQLVSNQFQTRELISSLCIPPGEEGKDKMRAPPESNTARFKERMVKQTRARIYQVLNPDHADDAKIIRMLDKWRSGVKLFRQQAWRHARLKFQLIMDTITDTPSTRLIGFLKNFERYNVVFGDGWRGLWSIDSHHQEIIHNYFQEGGTPYAEQQLEAKMEADDDDDE